MAQIIVRIPKHINKKIISFCNEKKTSKELILREVLEVFLNETVINEMEVGNPIFLTNDQVCRIATNIKSIEQEQTRIMEDFVKLANSIHMSAYTYNDKVLVKNCNKLSINCSKHGVFYKFRYNHITKEGGCPICKSSRGEIKIATFLIQNKVSYTYQKTFKGLIGLRNRKFRYDFYLNDYNLCIEFDGEGHYYPVKFGGINIKTARKIFERCKVIDKVKNQYCQNNNIELLRIPYTEFKNIEKILETVLIKKEKIKIKYPKVAA